MTSILQDGQCCETLPGDEMEGCQVVPLDPVTQTSSSSDIMTAFDEFSSEKTCASNHGSRRLHVLVVDDDPSFAFTCARFLETAGHLVTIARDGRSAIQLGREQRFDAVVTDINLPDGNGLQVLQNLRLADASLPFVLVTGDPQLDTARAAVECGAISYLLKPVSAMQLESVVERAFQARQTAELLAAVKSRGDELRVCKESLARAIAGLWIAFQPIVSWSKRGIAGYEALVRTTEPAFPGPTELIKSAIQLHQLVPLGQRIRQLIAGLMFGHDAIPTVFVNLHALELLDEDLYDPSSPLAAVADHVYFEISEQAALDDVDDFVNRTKRLRDLGFRIAVSDIAGAGSGLGSLALLEPDAVKMEVSLLRGIANPAVSRRLTRAALTLCHDLGVPLVAEGIETEAERDAFAAEGGDLMQGFLFGNPGFPPPSPRF
jgi:EAL domain-containing protein (putative c-di-GMP-specific phosphodiesterase class I)